MKIGLFSTFYRIDPAYSLCSVVLDQLSALVKNGHSPVLFTLPQFADEALVPEGVEIRKIVPQVILEPYKELNFPDHYKEDVAKVKSALEKNMQDITPLQDGRKVLKGHFSQVADPNHWREVRKLVANVNSAVQLEGRNI